MKSIKNDDNKKIINKLTKKNLEENEYLSLTDQELVNKILEIELFDKDIKKSKKNLENLTNNLKRKSKKINNFNKALNYYPSLNDPEFNYKLLRKKEFVSFYEEDKNNEEKLFSDIADSKCNNNTTGKFELSKSQQFLRNFMSPETPYNSLLLIHGTGVGKTCAAISIAEQFIPYVIKSGMKIIILASGALGKQFMKEVFDTDKYLENYKKDTNYIYSGCTGSTYLNLIKNQEINNSFENNDAFKKEMKRIKKRRYQDYGYDMFANRVSDIEKAATMFIPSDNKKEIEKAIIKAYQDHFSNTVIIVDEVQNLKTTSNDDSKNKKKKITDTFQRIIENVINIKLILLSATPMFDQASEIIYLLNLMLKNDKRELINKNDFFDKNENFIPESEKKLSEVMRGYISYIRGQNPYNFPFRLTPDINNDNKIIDFSINPKFDIKGKLIPDNEKIKYLKIIGNQMSSFQYQLYLKYTNGNFDKSILYNDADKYNDQNVFNKEENTIYRDYIIPRQVSDIVFPSEDTIGLKSCFSYYNVYSGPFKYLPNTINKYGYFLKRDLIGKYSCKFKSILDYILNSSGPVFIFTEWIPFGIIPLSLILEQNGFKRYNNNQLLDLDCPKISYDGRPESEFKNIKDFHQAYYSIYTGVESLSGDKENMIKTFKDKENINGKLIKVILVSVAGSEGLDLSGIREVHITDPWWNLNRIEQTIGRSIRNCSHKYLDMKYRNVTIYLHAAIPPTPKEQEKETIDLYMYRIALKKQIEISKIENILKRSAIDCYINKNINSFPISKINTQLSIETSQKKKVVYQVGDHPFSSLCNYQEKCDYQCDPHFEISKTDIDNSTFNEYFSESDLNKIKNEIKNIFYVNSILKIDEILKKIKSNSEVSSIDDLYIYIALSRMIKDKYLVIDKFNRKGYLKYKNLYYYFSPNQLSDDTFKSNEYNDINNSFYPKTYKDSQKNINYGLINNNNKDDNNTLEYNKSIDNIYSELNDLNLKINKQKIMLDDKFWIDKKDKIKYLLWEIIIDRMNESTREIILKIILVDKALDKHTFDNEVYLACNHYIIYYNYKYYYYKYDNNNIIKFFSLSLDYKKDNIYENINMKNYFITASSQISEKLLKTLKDKKYNLNIIYGFMKDSEFKLVNNTGIEKNSTGVVCNNVNKPPIVNSINILLGYQKYNSEGIIFKENLSKKKKIKVLKEWLCLELQLILRYHENYSNQKNNYFIRDYELFNI